MAGQSEEEIQSSESPTPEKSNLVIIENDNEISPSLTPKCVSSFSSMYVNLKFEYNSCLWEVDENIITTEFATESTITAKHTSGNEVVIDVATSGMGGGYPDCYQVGELKLLDNDVIRAHNINKVSGNDGKNYEYLTGKNDYAIKDYSGSFGKDKFNEYFTLLNLDENSNANMCWRLEGVNTVTALRTIDDPTNSGKNYREILVSIDQEVTDKEFLKASDDLAVSVFSSITL